MLVATDGEDTVARTLDLARLGPFPVTIRMPRWRPAWSEEFDGAELDRRWWHVWDSPSESKSELGIFMPQQVSVESGMLRMRIDAARASDGRHPTGAVTSHYAQRYGRIEVRARLPGGRGLWPAHWMTNADSADPVFEMDIMELLGANPHRVYFHNHYLTSVGIGANVGGSYSGDDFTAGFHTFGLDWYPGNLVWRVDGVERFRAVDGVSDRACFIRLSTQIGGNWGGPPDETTTFPQYHDVDWVRFHELVE